MPKGHVIVIIFFFLTLMQTAKKKKKNYLDYLSVVVSGKSAFTFLLGSSVLWQ